MTSIDKYFYNKLFKYKEDSLPGEFLIYDFGFFISQDNTVEDAVIYLDYGATRMPEDRHNPYFLVKTKLDFNNQLEMIKS